MSLRLITPAAALAVSLAEAKLHLRVDGADEDSLITALITAAAETAEQITGRAIMPQTWELTLDAFPDALELTRVPALSVTSVKYYDTTGAQITLAGSAYSLDNVDDFGPAYVAPAYGAEWPGTREQINAVAVRYVAGYADAASVPAPIKQWMLLQIGAMYANREREAMSNGGAVTLKFADGLLDRYRVYA